MPYMSKFPLQGFSFAQLKRFKGSFPVCKVEISTSWDKLHKTYYSDTFLHHWFIVIAELNSRFFNWLQRFFKVCQMEYATVLFFFDKICEDWIRKKFDQWGCNILIPMTNVVILWWTIYATYNGSLKWNTFSWLWRLSFIGNHLFREHFEY